MRLMMRFMMMCNMHMQPDRITDSYLNTCTLISHRMREQRHNDRVFYGAGV